VSHRTIRLGPEHVEDLVDLYGEASRSYFTTQRLEREIYVAIYVDGRIASAAGTHVRSKEAGIAAVGNVLTRIPYRDRGMATTVTSAVTTIAPRARVAHFGHSSFDPALTSASTRMAPMGSRAAALTPWEFADGNRN